jgi:hypothetical protein
MMIVICFALFALLCATVVAEEYFQRVQRRLEAHWHVATTDPPTVNWGVRSVYACFLSHYKTEAASDARYLHDALPQMLHAPVFLDSSSLKDLRLLVTEGVFKSDVLVALLTKGYLTRPWCLLEIFAAVKRGIPIISVEVAGGRFSTAEMREYIECLPKRLAEHNPAGLDLLQQCLGTTPIEELQQVVLSVIPDEGSDEGLIFDSSASDQAMLASMKSIVEAMAAASGRELLWRPAKSSGSTKLPWELWEDKKHTEEDKRRDSEEDKRNSEGGGAGGGALRFEIGLHRSWRVPSALRSRHHRHHTIHMKAVVLFDSSQASDAHVLRMELARKLNSAVGLGGDNKNLALVAHSHAVVVLLSKRLFVTPQCVVEIYAAVRAGVKVITVLASHGDYSFEDTRARLGGTLDAWVDSESEGDFQSNLAAKLVTLQKLHSLSKTPDLSVVQKSLYNTLTATIAIHWQPHAGPNHHAAVMADIAAAIPKKPSYQIHHSSRGMSGHRRGTSRADSPDSRRAARGESYVRRASKCVDQISVASEFVRAISTPKASPSMDAGRSKRFLKREKSQGRAHRPAADSWTGLAETSVATDFRRAVSTSEPSPSMDSKRFSKRFSKREQSGRVERISAFSSFDFLSFRRSDRTSTGQDGTPARPSELFSSPHCV